MRSVLLLYCILTAALLPAQTFTAASGTLPFEGVRFGAVAISDVDGDGSQDVLLTGENSASALIANLYLNDGAGHFTEKDGVPFAGVYRGGSAFSDVDGDGDQDLLITGRNDSFEETANLYLNDGAGNFTEETGLPFDGVWFSAVAFSDVDGDGDEDLLLTGENGSLDHIAKLYDNDGTGNFTERAGQPFEGVVNGAVAFADVDGNSSPDLLITGKNNAFDEIAKLYLNDGAGNFTEQPGLPLPGVELGAIAFADVDGNGSPDLVITGYNGSSPIARLYINDGAGTFSEASGVPFDGVDGSTATFSDLDRDGDQDILITGLNSASSRIAKLFSNDGAGNFSEMANTPFEGVSSGAVAFLDMDGDQDQDVLLTGQDASFSPSIKLYINNSTVTSTSAIQADGEEGLLLYPNPSTKGIFWMEYTVEKETNIRLSLIDQQGSMLIQQDAWATPGLNKLSISYPALPKGLYLLRLEDGQSSRLLKAVVR